MALIAILISLVIERFLGSLEELRTFAWFTAYYRWGTAKMRGVERLNGPLGSLLLLLPLFVLTAAVSAYLSALWLVFGLAFAVLILLYSIGPRDLEAEVEAFIDARSRDDEESACWHASELAQCEVVSHSGELTKQIMQNIFIEANERLLAIIFWFVVLGPAGALLYRLSSLLRQQPQQEGDAIQEAGVRLHKIMCWPAAYLCGVAFALAGSFVDGLQGIRHAFRGGLESSHDVLIGSGFGALRLGAGEIEDDSRCTEQVSESLALVRRAVMVFLSLLALFTLSGWMN